ncbi:uncharacterized protein LOC9325150 isoform X3 [Arabidopsis lyrata subsp. lyrata]|uniref:uncharacterized protein LOC9325150 isoform X3 n=1 Tax=Arabidopsis lyrata subsp. lyrata TaxID=81972 RepID=UPI000A29D39C|nr:uncharacterized protein LOC9325150 isoform X3 [Arabidopsis lyrata subsp. lyrata]|eukprot:XP_020890556.1 uncharacterized protein LOC9325150 isoform X3 [Arabidopsis lyrata subsp. lyrata]
MEPKSIVLVGIYDFRVSDYKIGIRKESTFPLHRTLCYILLCLLVFVNGLPCLGHENMFDVKALYVGKELWRETLSLQSGSRVYKLEGIPARFSLKLLKNREMGLKLNQMRRLLNTEKLMFKVESFEEVNNKAGLNVLVTVEPEGIVAIPNSKERSIIIYNIVCEEQLMGIPYSSWSVVILVALCLVVALVPCFLPSSLLLIKKDQGANSSHLNHGKDP